jgi:hypothetical protein
MLDIARILAAERQVVSRLGAVHVRRDALAVLARIVQHPACEGSHRRLAMNRIATELDHWPPDRRAWVGDRALGLHVYEMVRDGQLAAVLTEDERVRIRRTASLDELQQAVKANVDADEMVYLKLMRRLIDACDQPYYQRREVLGAIEQELFEMRDSTEYPFVADTILLTDVDKAHRLQAVDRARMDAWLLALQAATSNAPPPSPPVNPLTGEPLRLSVEPARIVVDGIDPATDERVVVPVAQSG